jgi:hypothetical protein
MLYQSNTFKNKPKTGVALLLSDKLESKKKIIIERGMKKS